MGDRKWIIAGFIILAGGIVGSHIVNAKDKTSFDKATSDTPYAPQQNDFYPLGILSRVGTHMAPPGRSYGPNGTPEQNWRQGGSSSITASTGRWAQ